MKPSNPQYVNNLHTKFFALVNRMFFNNNRAFFDDYEALINKYSPKGDCRTFIVGDVFCHGKGNNTWSKMKEPENSEEYSKSQHHHENFRTWYVNPSAKKEIRIDFDGIDPLSVFPCPFEMDMYQLQNQSRFSPMSEQVFSLVLFSLIIEPALGKQFLNYELVDGGKNQIFHLFPVQLDGGNVVLFDVVRVAAISMWDITIRPFDNSGYMFKPGEVLLYF